ncbi:Shr3 amino acid permease chaperone [Gymnopilus junonius]|uniref:Shr3 amino acid permease chaperone n=1 Tax=Gymnopilus junonius TaxID=109634 RepID=A0A9P5TLN7_GYMJU|nr:Shr3 amino acid permease chaperone [Gymnopilus junonius]
MGFKQAAVLAPVSFFLGVLFICFNVDHRLLWGEITEDVITDGFQFYTTFFNAPPAIKALLHGMVAVGLLGFLSKIHKWDESAMYFDGSSLVVYVFAIAVYLTVTVSCLRTIADPVKGVDTREDQVLAMRVLSAGNIIVIGCLLLVLFLQAGQEWAYRTEAKANAEREAEQRKKAAATTAEKKDQ